ncbi:hypothetical protein, partial [Methanosarcina sp. A14]|uniref:hypothetical protein n=1 Tax=Methanosarcina sp. A14 TaxID=1860098 RepID=UPI001C405F54
SSFQLKYVIQKEGMNKSQKRNGCRDQKQKRDSDRIKKEHTFPTEVLLLTLFYSHEGTVRKRVCSKLFILLYRKLITGILTYIICYV